MIKEKFAAQLAKEMRSLGFKLTVPAAEKFVDALAKSMAEGLIRDRKLIVSNFGSFESIKIGAKVINSPKGDKKKFFMPPTDIVKWHPSGKIRERAESTEIDDEEFEQIKGKLFTEDLPVIFNEAETIGEPEIKVAPQSDPYEVQVRYVKGQNSIPIGRSPLSKLIKSLLKEMLTQGSDKMKITPERFASQIIYFSGDNEQASKILPRDSHNLIVQEIVGLTAGQKEFMLFGKMRAKIEKNLTPFGTEITILCLK
ncbi:MAG: HU family DNA-binding protein [Patescibacteria group bacterium]|jgi:nucleoid DNA-binding protein